MTNSQPGKGHHFIRRPFFTVSPLFLLGPLLFPFLVAMLRNLSTAPGSIKPFQAWLCKCLLRLLSCLLQTGQIRFAWCERFPSFFFSSLLTVGLFAGGFRSAVTFGSFAGGLGSSEVSFLFKALVVVALGKFSSQLAASTPWLPSESLDSSSSSS